MSDDALEARCEPSLPPVLRIFCVSPETPEVAALTRQLNHLGCLSPRFLWAANSEQTLRALRQHPDGARNLLIHRIHAPWVQSGVSILQA